LKPVGLLIPDLVVFCAVVNLNSELGNRDKGVKLRLAPYTQGKGVKCLPMPPAKSSVKPRHYANLPYQAGRGLWAARIDG